MSFQARSAVIDSLLSDFDENFAKVAEMSETLVGDSNVSFLGLLCGDLPPFVVWKMMYLCSRERRIQERCTMLSVLSDYIVNTPGLLEIRGVARSSPARMIRVLAQMWDTTLSYACNVLNLKSLSALLRTLKRCAQALRPYSLHDELDNVIQRTISSKSSVDATLTKMADPLLDFPNNASISFSKIINYRMSAEQNFLMSTQQTGDQSTHRPRSSRPLVPASSVISRPSSGFHPTKPTLTRPTSSSARSLLPPRLPKKAVVPDTKIVDSESPIPRTMSASFVPAIGQYSTASSSKVLVAALLGPLSSSVPDSESPAIPESPVPRTMSASFALAMTTSATSSPKVVAAFLGPLRSVSSQLGRAVGSPSPAVISGARRRLELKLHEKQCISVVDADRSSSRGPSSYVSISAHTNSAHTNSAHTKSTHTNSAHTKSTHNNSAHTKSTHTKSTHTKSTHTNSAHTKSTHTNSAHTKSTHTKSTHTNSAHTKSTHTKSTHTKSTHTNSARARPASRLPTSESSAFSMASHDSAPRGLSTKAPRHNHALPYLSVLSESRSTYSSPYARKVLPVPAKRVSPPVGQELGDLKRRVPVTCIGSNGCSSDSNVTEELFFDSQ